MKKNILALLFLGVLNSTSYAGSYTQTIKMHVHYIGSHIQESVVCINTYGTMDHCGTNVTLNYNNGPKKWYLTTRNFWNKFTMDESCLIMDKHGKIETPRENGVLNIYATAKSSNIFKTNTDITNCSYTWMPSK